MMNRILTRRLLKRKEAAEYLGICERKLEYLKSKGFICETRLPDTRKILYDLLDLDALIDKNKENQNKK